jgi:hypothetical protein
VLVTTRPKWVYMLNSVEKWLCESEKKKKKIIKKPLIREGTNSSSIPELIINLSKNPDVSFVVI